MDRRNKTGSGLDRAELMSFLLGELDEAETTRIEGVFLSENGDAAKQELEEAREALRTNYDQGKLDARRKQAFERRFLVEAAAVEQQMALDALPTHSPKQESEPAPAAQAAAPAPKKKSGSRLGAWLGGLFSK